MSVHLRTLARAALAACLCMIPATMPDASATGAERQYLGGGTVAVRSSSGTVLDEGVVTCDETVAHTPSPGGFCLPFGGGDSVALHDLGVGENIAFQVCIDNSGDGVCTSPDVGPCADVVEFSHDDSGNFYNPVGPLPTGFASGCGGGAAFEGYVVFTCNGVHAAGTSIHLHPTSGGSATVTSGGEGFGTFCGGSTPAPSRKRYRVVRDQAPCRIAGVVQPEVTGVLTAESVVTGTVTSADVGAPPGSTLSLQCVVRRNGQVAGVTSQVNGIEVVNSTEKVQFTAPLGSRLQICAEITVNGGALQVVCTQIVPTELPSTSDRAVLDAVAANVYTTTGGTVCPVLQPQAGSYGVFTIKSDGDVFVDSALVYDCVPYDPMPPGQRAPQIAAVLLGGFGV